MGQQGDWLHVSLYDFEDVEDKDHCDVRSSGAVRSIAFVLVSLDTYTRNVLCVARLANFDPRACFLLSRPRNEMLPPSIG